MSSTNAIKVLYFCSDANKDQKLLEELEKHLSSLKRQGVIATWHKGMIVAGKEIETEIYTQLSTADIILPLISSDFIASDDNWEMVAKCAMDRHSKRQAHVIPILLRPVENSWKSAFPNVKALPQDEKPVTDWKPYDRAFKSIAEGIRTAVNEITNYSFPVKKSLQQIGAGVIPVVNTFVNVASKIVNVASTSFSSLPKRSRRYRRRKSVSITPIILIAIAGFFLPQISNLLEIPSSQRSQIVSTQNISPIGWIWIGKVNSNSTTLPIGKGLLKASDSSINPPFVPSAGALVTVDKSVNLRTNVPYSYKSILPKQISRLEPGQKLIILKVKRLVNPAPNSSDMKIWAQVGRCNQVCDQ